MPLSPGTRFGPYEIVAPIGAGGMGEVYRATDSHLKRSVAIKVLPAAVAGDADRLARFQREAEVLAALNHPNIAAVYGLEKTAELTALVMELVEGEDLSAHIARGPIAPAEAVPLATQIADALEAAHEQGIIHRDLKPANIKVRADGTVKVLDFGLAKAMDPVDTSSANAMNSPTLTARATEMGVILGTAAYMSPEQARGKPVDRRADIWAFGAVLYEMLTGRRAFDGETVSDTLAAVLKQDPDVNALPPDIPAAIRRLIRRCLEKDPRRRLSAIGDARLELDEPAEAPGVPAPARGGWPFGRTIGLAAAALVLGAAGALLAAGAFRAAPLESVARFSLLPPADIAIYPDSTSVVLSPDGQSVVFVEGVLPSPSALWVRRLDTLEAARLAGTEGGMQPFWSPDSREIAFFASGRLKRVPAAGGQVQEIAAANDGRGGDWNADGVILFAPENAGPIMQVAATGGTPTPVTTLDADRGENGHRSPTFLPDGRHFLYAALPPDVDGFSIFVGSLDGSAPRFLMKAESTPIFVTPGYLLFSRLNALVAQRFDPQRLELSGGAVALGGTAGAIAGNYFAGHAVSASTTGTLAYLAPLPGGPAMHWLDRQGRSIEEIGIPPAQYNQAVLSPDGRLALLTRYTGPFSGDLWVADLQRGGTTLLSNAPGTALFPAWGPDSDQLAFASNRNGPMDIFTMSAGGGSPERVVLESEVLFKYPQSWSRDGRYLVYYQNDPKTNEDLWVLEMTGSGETPQAYLRTPASEGGGVLSPDGRWMAYVSNESGQPEAYVQAFPTPGRRFRVTTNGASQVWWRHDGRQLLIARLATGTLLTSDVQSAGGEFRASVPQVVGRLPAGVISIDALPDFQRLLVLIANSASTSMVVVQHWQAALGDQ